MDPHSLYTTEPAPMGIADFGVNKTLVPYSYTTNAFLANASISSLTLHNSTSGSTSGSLQLNAVLRFVENSTRYEYWIQDVAFIDTQSHLIQFLDNVWNFSSPGASVYNSTLVGNGVVDSSIGFYYDVAPSTLPGNDLFLGYPAAALFEITSGVSPSGEPMVTFAYNDGFGWQTFDQVLFRIASDPRTLVDSGFVVDGHAYNARGLFDDVEFTVGGPGGGASTAAGASGVALTIEFDNGHNWQQTSSAWNAGSDTAEAVSNVLESGQSVVSTGALFGAFSAGAGGTLAPLWDTVDVNQLTVTTPSVTTATFWIGGAGVAYSGGMARLVVKGSTAPYSLEIAYLGHTEPMGPFRLPAGASTTLNFRLLSAPSASLSLSATGRVVGHISVAFAGAWNWSGATGSLRLYSGGVTGGVLASVLLATGLTGSIDLDTTSFADGNYSVVYQVTTPFFVSTVNSSNLYFDNLELALTAQIVGLAAELNSKNLSVAELRAELSAANVTLANLTVEVSLLGRELGQNSSVVGNLTAEIANLSARIVALNASLANRAGETSPAWYDGTRGAVVYGLAAATLSGGFVLGWILGRRGARRRPPFAPFDDEPFTEQRQSGR